MDWLKVDITTTSEAVEALNETLLFLSPSGLLISEEGLSVTATVYLPDSVSPESARIMLEQALEDARVSGLRVEPARIAFSSITDEDWIDNYQKFFKVLRIGRLLIKPSWEEAKAGADDILIQLDPGLAFGTGWHPTTAGCLWFLQTVLKGGETVCDLGTGSGILAIAAAKLGAARVIAIDNDAEAIHVAEENAGINGVSAQIDFITSDFSDLQPVEADILVANLTAPLIVGFLPELSHKLLGLTAVIVSGIMRSQSDDVISALQSHGYAIEMTHEEGDWVSMVGRHV